MRSWDFKGEDPWKKVGINNIIFTNKSNGEKKKKGQKIKTEKIKQQQRERRQKIRFIPFVRLFIS